MITKCQKFECITIHRKEINNAPYNPRKIGKAERARLKANIKRVGLIDTLIWNRQTGNLVGGHQRINIIDEIEGNDDYEITVSVVSLSEDQEKEQNIFLNSKSAQGQFDFELLKQIAPDINIGNCGLDNYDLAIMGISYPIIEIDSSESCVIENQKNIRLDSNENDIDREERKREMQELRKKIVDDFSAVEIGETHITLSFSSNIAKSDFLKIFNLPDGMRMVKGEPILEKCKNITL